MVSITAPINNEVRVSVREYLGVLLYLATLASPVLKPDKFIIGPQRKQTAQLEQRWGW